jgi:hypothetical protein
MKFTHALFAAVVGSVQSQLTCDVLPGMVSLDTQDNECCGAAIVLVSAGAIAGGMGGMLGGACLHMTNYAEFFPDGCTDCTQPGDDDIERYTPGSSPTLTTMAAAQVALCCKEVGGGFCHQAIVAGAATGAGAMNSQVAGGFDWDGDGNVDLCADAWCGPTAPPTPAPPTASPTPAPPTASPTVNPCFECTELCRDPFFDVLYWNYDYEDDCKFLNHLLQIGGCAASCLDTQEGLAQCIEPEYYELECTVEDFVLQVNEELSNPCDACGAFSECFDADGNFETNCSVLDPIVVCEFCAPCFGGTIATCPINTPAPSAHPTPEEAFECHDGSFIPLHWVNDRTCDCRDCEDETPDPVVDLVTVTR